MKKLYAVMTICALALSIGVTALAQGKTAKGSKKSGSCCSTKGEATPEQVRKFKLDTIDLRQEMMTKKFDLQRENLKESPDSARVDALKAEIANIKTRIEAVRESSKLPQSVCNRVCGMMDEDCGSCNKAGSCGCKECQKGKSCSNCTECKDCSCHNCGHGQDCNNCNKAHNKKGKAAKHCNGCNTRK
jgi:hypothetical protein